MKILFLQVILSWDGMTPRRFWRYPSFYGSHKRYPRRFYSHLEIPANPWPSRNNSPRWPFPPPQPPNPPLTPNLDLSYLIDDFISSLALILQFIPLLVALLPTGFGQQSSIHCRIFQFECACRSGGILDHQQHLNYSGDRRSESYYQRRTYACGSWLYDGHARGIRRRYNTYYTLL